MKKPMIIAALAAAIFTLSACTKCAECTDCIAEQTICRDGYDSTDDYEDAIDGAEAIGCECVRTVK